MKDYRSSINVFIVGIFVLICVVFVANTFVTYKKTVDNGISVTGSSTKNFVSDLIVWRGYFSRFGETTKEAYTILKQDADSIRQYLIDSGVKEDEIVFSSVEIRANYVQERRIVENKPDEYYYVDVLTGYNLSQNVTIESNDVDKIEGVSRDVTKLIDTGVELFSYAPEYYYTKLDELKIEMISEATENARLRAEKIAENSKSQVGDLKDASLGVFQITAQNSAAEEYSYGGVFNTSSKNKTASITIKLNYDIKN